MYVRIFVVKLSDVRKFTLLIIIVINTRLCIDRNNIIVCENYGN